MLLLPLQGEGGSSPWARGTHLGAYLEVDLSRFIPVGTGNTHLFWCHFSRNSVHPRGHGEHEIEASEAGFQRGSSPWARGTL